MSSIENPIGKWVSVLYRYRKSYASKMLEPYGIVGCQYLFLTALYSNDGSSQEKISDFLKIDKTTTAKAIKKLEDNGYVKRVVDLGDKRAYKVFLTQKAQDIIPKIKEIMTKWETTIISQISEDEYQNLERLLKKMAEKAYEIGNT